MCYHLEIKNSYAYILRLRSFRGTREQAGGKEFTPVYRGSEGWLVSHVFPLTQTKLFQIASKFFSKQYLDGGVEGSAIVGTSLYDSLNHLGTHGACGRISLRYSTSDGKNEDQGQQSCSVHP